MKYIYYKAKTGNFGDDLNGWLWPKLFGALPERNDEYFIGIGSLLNGENKLFKDLENKKKIVFGTGVRPTYKKFNLDPSWDIRFLRGPLSSKFLDNKYEHIVDAAYALRLIDHFKDYLHVKKKYEISLIPYFHSIKYFNWEKICQKLGFHYISPLSEEGVDHTLKEMAASKFIISEAMHGAIVSDILRVPWHRFVLSTPHNEGGMVSEFKWMDWLHSINVGYINTSHIKLYRKSVLNTLINRISGNRINTEFVVKKIVLDELLKELRDVKDFYLSKDTTVNIIDDRLNDKVDEIKRVPIIGFGS